MENIKPFDLCLYAMPFRFKRILEYLPDEIKDKTQEIRLRSNLPLSLTIDGKPIFVLKDGQTSVNKSEAVICSNFDITECFRLLTKQSVYAHTDEIKNGFIRMDYGNRAGICGTFSDVGMVSNVSGISIRIARQIIGCCEKIYRRLVGGIVVLGPPGSGKTTIIRDLVRMKSNDGKRVSVIDTRGEITATNYGVSPFDLGANTDIYLIDDKAKGIEMAVRTMFPDVIAFDEIGNMKELTAVKESFNAGIDIITSAHIGSFEDIKRRDIIRGLLNSEAIKTIVILPENIGGDIEIFDVGEIKI